MQVERPHGAVLLGAAGAAASHRFSQRVHRSRRWRLICAVKGNQDEARWLFYVVLGLKYNGGTGTSVETLDFWYGQNHLFMVRA